MNGSARAGGHAAGRGLIVNADDYGLTGGVSLGILRAHREGVVTSTSVLSLGPAFESAVAWLSGEELAAGVHLAAVGEDPPLLSRSEIPSLVDHRGRLPASWRAFLWKALAGRIDHEDLVREFSVQVERVVSAGVRPTHLDSHQHLHLLPPVREAALDVAARFGIQAVRVPRSRRGVRRAAINRLASRLAARADELGLLHPDDASGLDEAGRIDASLFSNALDAFTASGARVAEINVHPGEADDSERERYRWGYRWASELALLTAPEVRKLLESKGFTGVSYADLAAFAAKRK